MTTDKFYVNKTSGTAADTLLAIGFAKLLQIVLYRSGKTSKGITIRDIGPSYEIRLPVEITASDLERLTPFTLIHPLLSEKQKKKGQIMLDAFDYQEQMEISKTYFARLKDLPPHLRTPEARWRKAEYPALAAIQEPDKYLGHYQVINQMKIASSFNELAQRWSALDTLQRLYIHLLLRLFSQPENDVEEAIISAQVLAKEHGLKGKVEVTALQIVNPTTGKGANRPKASTLAEGNQDGFWLLELLKFVGFFLAAAPYVVRGSKDRKTYVLQPHVLELTTLEHMMKLFRSVCWSTTVVKLDILASLRFAQTFIRLRREALEDEQSDDDDDFLEEKNLYSVAQGFEVAFYKDMGSAYATLNVATINFPQWLQPITTFEAATNTEEVLQEHLRIIQGIRTSKGEEGSEEYELLRFYRDFLSGRELKPFWKFTTAYSSYLISRRERDPRSSVRQFSVTGLESLLAMHRTGSEKKLTDITSDSGFQRVAYAIRQSTVKAQYRRSQLRDRTYEVRYGLGQELMREARYKDKFTAALAEFLHQYNAETAREEEKAANQVGGAITPEIRRARKLRGTVSKDDLDAVVQLIELFGSELIAALLVTYGYASDTRQRTAEADTGDSDAPIEPEDTSSDEE